MASSGAGSCASRLKNLLICCSHDDDHGGAAEAHGAAEEADQNPMEKVREQLTEIPEVTPEDLDELVALVKAKLARLDSSSSTSNDNSMLSKFKQQTGVVESFFNTIPDNLTETVVGVGKSAFLPLVKRVLGGVGTVHWMGLGFSFVAWTLETADTMGQNQEECLSLLKEVVFLFKGIKELMGRATDSFEEDLLGVIDVALRCALICTSKFDTSYICRFLTASTTNAELANLMKECEAAHNKLASIGIFAVVDKIFASTEQVLLSKEDIVGGDKVFKEAMEHLNGDSSDVVAVFLVGMGGIGKSMLARSIFVHFQEHSKNKYCFCMVVNTEEVKINQIQKEIAQKIKKSKVSNIWNALDGREILKKELVERKSPIFLYVDNVMGSSQLSELLPEASFFHSGSKILITTRNEYTSSGLSRLGVRCKIIKLKKLDNDTSEKIFWRQFEKQGGISSNLKADMPVVDVLKLCGGLPLALEVVGSHIANNDKGLSDIEVWEDVISAMKEARPLEGEDEDELYSPLKVSIEKLEPQARRAFFDIIAFGKGEPWLRVERLVNSSNQQFMKMLLQHSLIEKAETKVNNKFGIDIETFDIVEVHDVLQMLGQRMTGMQSKDEFYITSDDKLNEFNITNEDKLNDATESLKNLVGLSNVQISASLLQKVRNLRVLKNVQLTGECKDIHLRELRVVWHLTSDTATPFNFNTCTSLKELTWSVEGADSVEVGGLPKGLEVLHLYSWEALEKIEGIGSLTGLKELRLEKCFNLMSLPKEFARLTGLKELCLEKCFNLMYLPEGFARLTGLRKLSVIDSRLRCLPAAIAGLTSLMVLDLSGCDELEALPEEIAGLTGLKTLDLASCTSLELLPDRISCLSGLRSINLSFCLNLRTLPDGFTCLTGLKDMYLGGCDNLQPMSEGVTNMLERLNIARVPKSAVS